MPPVNPSLPEPVADQMVMVPGDRPYMLIVPLDTGFVSVRGPLNNPGLCYNWLGQAFEYVLRRNLKNTGRESSGAIVLPEGSDAGDGKPGGG
jgi:hypothetical protein